LTTALARHGLAYNIPARIDVAIPRGHRIPVLQSPVDIRAFAKDTFELGRGELKVRDGFSVGLYSPERSLVDVIRLRHREGTDIAWDALHRWLADGISISNGRRSAPGGRPAILILRCACLRTASRLRGRSRSRKVVAASS
jgi:hypothetical protein